MVSDYYTKWPEAFALRTQSAENVARVLVDEVFSRSGIPGTLHSDQGRNFESSLIKEVCALLGIRKSWTTAYHPQGDGLVERLKRTLLAFYGYTSQNTNKTGTRLPAALMAYRTTKQASTQARPFKLMFDRDPRKPTDVTFNTRLPPPQFVTDYARHLQEQQHSARELVDAHLTAAQARQRANYNRGSTMDEDGYRKGELVWLHNSAVKRGLSPKLVKKWTGPFKVIEKHSPQNYKIQYHRGGRTRRVHTNRLKRCYRRFDDRTGGAGEEITASSTEGDEHCHPDSIPTSEIPPVVDHYEVDPSSENLPVRNADHNLDPELELQQPRRRCRPAWMTDYVVEDNT